MLIKEACERCGLTKKALAYYEEKNLIQPHILENGYRDYNGDDISLLREISLLRQCGISLADIKGILRNANKPAALAKGKYIARLRMQRLNAIQECMEDLIKDYDVDRGLAYIRAHGDGLYTIKEKLALAFPGNYGLFIALHFGRFLNEQIDTDEKQKAYKAALRYLDNMECDLAAPELSEFLEACPIFSENTETLSLQISQEMSQAITDTDAYLERSHEEIEQYFAYKNSEEFRASPAAQIQRHLIEFQKKSGYREIFIANMKILSNSYADYLEQVNIANQKFIQRFPMIRNL